MALIKCPECGAEISDREPTCPKCGHPVSSKTSIYVIWGWIHIVLGVIMISATEDDAFKNQGLYEGIVAILLLVFGALSLRKIKKAFQALLVVDIYILISIMWLILKIAFLHPAH